MDRKDFLVSIKPCYANLIVEGVKKIELRKKFPVDVKAGTKMVIYSSAPQSMIIGECYIDSVKELSIDELWNESCIEAMISWSDFETYFSGHSKGYAIRLKGHLRYEKPFALSKHDFLPDRPPQSYCYLENVDAKQLS